MDWGRFYLEIFASIGPVKYMFLNRENIRAGLDGVGVGFVLRIFRDGFGFWVYQIPGMGVVSNYRLV